MGKSITPKYRLEIDGHVQSWPKGIKPSNETLEEYVYKFGKSLEFGGVNYHLSVAHGYIPYPSNAVVVEQKTGVVVANWRAAMFQAW